LRSIISGIAGETELSPVAADQQVDFLIVEQPPVDFGHEFRIGLIVDADHLDLSPEQPALLIDVLLPNLMSQTRGLAV
jgi:hypothetical protein